MGIAVGGLFTTGVVGEKEGGLLGRAVGVAVGGLFLPGLVGAYDGALEVVGEGVGGSFFAG